MMAQSATGTDAAASSSAAPGSINTTGKPREPAEDTTTSADDDGGTAGKMGTLRDFIAQQKLEMLQQSEKPPLTFWEQVLISIYNPEAGEYLGRSFYALLFSIAFNILFYGCLVGLILLLANVHPDIHEHENMPHYIGHDSFFGDDTIPLGMLPFNEGNRRSMMIRFDPDRNETWESYVNQLKTFVQAEEQNPAAFTNCSGHGLDQEWKDGDKLCKVYDNDNTTAATDWGPCTPENVFGYAAGKPCVLLKLNRALMWTPKEITAAENMTEFVLKELKYGAENVPVWVSSNQTRNLTQEDRVVCISCTGAFYSGEMRAAGRFDAHYPVVSAAHPTGSCLPLYYFPFKNQPHYQSPFVLVEFAEVPRNRSLKVICSAFNTGISRDPGIGTLSFELELSAGAEPPKSKSMAR